MNTISKIAVGLLSLGYANTIMPLKVTMIKMSDPNDKWSYVIETFKSSDSTKKTKKQFDKKTSTTFNVNPSDVAGITIIKKDGQEIRLTLTSEDRGKLEKGDVIVIKPDESYQMVPKNLATKGSLLTNMNKSEAKVMVMKLAKPYLTIDLQPNQVVYLPIPKDDAITLDANGSSTIISTDVINKTQGMRIKGKSVLFGK